MLGYQAGGRFSQEERGADTATSRGTVITASASANTKGSWTNIGAVTGYEYNTVSINAAVAGAGAADFTFDLGINDSGSVDIIAADLRLPGLVGNRSNTLCCTLPLHVRQGAQLAARCQASTGSRTMEIGLHGMPTGHGGNPGASKIVALYTPSSSRGVDVEPTVVNTKSSWVTLVAASTQQFDGMFFIIGNGGETTRSSNLPYLLDIGVNATPRVIYGNIFLNCDSVTTLVSPAFIGPVWFSTGLAAIQLSARAQTNDVTVGERKIDVAAYGLVGF
jgi:hypothetical protein